MICREGTGLPPSMDLCHKVFYSVINSPKAFTLWILTSSNDVVKALKSEGLLSPSTGTEGLLAKVESSLAKANFPVYAAVQRSNEVLIIPPGSVYMSTTFGEYCVQVTWDIHTPFSLERAVASLVPCCRLIKQLEHHKIKAMAYYTLSNVLAYVESRKSFAMDPGFADDFQRLVRAVESVALEEGIPPVDSSYPPPSRPPFSRVCCFCGCNIFNRGYECPECGLDVCVPCAAEGMGCGMASHFGSLVLREFIPAKELWEKVTRSKQCYLELIKGSGKSFPSSTASAAITGGRSLMSIAQIQIARAQSLSHVK